MTTLQDMSNRVVDSLTAGGAMIGLEIMAALQIDTPDISTMQVWKACTVDPRLRTTNAARFYLRYDITRNNQLRLSPSILRNFLSFTLVHTRDQDVAAVERSVRLANRHRKISLRKLMFARRAILRLEPDVLSAVRESACVFIAGDIAYFLAHDEARKTPDGYGVAGSDIDLLFVHRPGLDPAIIAAAEAQMGAVKYQYLKDPAAAQEIDFLFKPVTKMVDQFAYATIADKIASKILYESMYLYGDLNLYDSLRRQLELSGAARRIEADFETALVERRETIATIYDLPFADLVKGDRKVDSLFFFSQERLEFE